VFAVAGRERGVGETEGESAVTGGNGLTDAAACRDASRRLTSYIVDLVDLGPEPDWHLDRRLYGPWQRYELVARNPAGDELARARGTANTECWYRLAGELHRTMSWTR
jgi:hypothetical protein